MKIIRVYLVLFVLVAAAAGGGIAWYRSTHQPGQVQVGADAAPEVQTSAVRRGDLVIYASGFGSVVAAAEADLSFGKGGTLDAVYVTVGDQVSAGDLLAQQEGVALLEADVSSARLELSAAQAELDALYVDAELARSEAAYDLLTVRQTLADLEEERVEMDYQRCSDNTIDIYNAAYLSAVSSYDRQLFTYNLRYAHLAFDDIGRLNAEVALLDAETAVSAALANLEYCTNTYTEEEIASADVSLVVARADLEQAEAAWEELGEDGLDDDAVQLAEQEVLEAEIKLAEAEADLDASQLVAPFDGIVTAVKAGSGEYVGTGAIITVADMSLPMLEVFLDETDSAMIAAGSRAEIIFDAIPDTIFNGEVRRVDPKLVTSDNVSYVRGIVLLESDSYAKPQALAIGMNATVDVIGGEAQDALLVPVEALQETDSGGYAVYVVGENGEPGLRTVAIGLVDFTYAEVVDGLEEGELVATH